MNKYTCIGCCMVRYNNANASLFLNGTFVGSVATTIEPWHVSVFSKEYWYNQIFDSLFFIEEYPFKYKVRSDESTSFYIKLKKKIV